MKFYGYGIVWDADSNKPLCEFKDGELETKDDDVIERLTELDYKNDGAKIDKIVAE